MNATAVYKAVHVCYYCQSHAVPSHLSVCSTQTGETHSSMPRGTLLSPLSFPQKKTSRFTRERCGVCVCVCVCV